MATESRTEALQRARGSRRYLKRTAAVLPPEEKGAVTFQFAEEERQRLRSRLYVWGNAQYGALGQPSFLMPHSPRRNILTQMHKPFR